MQTRSTRNLKRVQMMDLIVDDPDAVTSTTTRVRPQRKRERCYKEQPVAPQMIDYRKREQSSSQSVPPPSSQSVSPSLSPQSVVVASPPLVVPFQSLSDVLRSRIYTADANKDSAWNVLQQQHSVTAAVTDVFLVLDTESYQIESELGSKTIVPLQVAWGVYKWNENSLRLDLISKNTCYITEIMCIGRFRDAIKSVSERSYLKHEANMKTKGYPLLAVKDLLKVLHETITENCVSTIVGYNVSWDFAALANLIQLFGVEHPSFDCRCNNPFNPLRIRHLDLMHEMIKKYGRHLVHLGIKDGSVHKDPHNKTWLRKNTKYSKTIYSAEYVLEHLFGISQQHLADDDVEHEALILERVIQQFGVASLEYGILYPQKTSYEYMVRKANEVLAGETDTEEAVKILSQLNVLQRHPTPFPAPLPAEQSAAPLPSGCLFFTDEIV